ncbi:transmembrane protein 272-like [Aulostomus maculatus]
MNSYTQMDFRPQNGVLISTIVVVNIIWWMVLIAAIGLGATHVGSCPVQPYIPVYLVILGVTSLLSLIITYSNSIWEGSIVSITVPVCMSLLYTISFCWFIAGTYWVYNVYPPSYSSGTTQYCHRITYQFAFAVTTLLWVFVTLFFVCGCCFILLTCCKSVVSRNELSPIRSTFYGATEFQGDTAGGV